MYRATASATAGVDTAAGYYLELRFGPKQKMSVNLSHLIPTAMPAVFNEDVTEAAWKQPESGISVYSYFRPPML